MALGDVSEALETALAARADDFALRKRELSVDEFSKHTRAMAAAENKFILDTMAAKKALNVIPNIIKAFEKEASAKPTKTTKAASGSFDKKPKAASPQEKALNDEVASTKALKELEAIVSKVGGARRSRPFIVLCSPLSL